MEDTYEKKQEYYLTNYRFRGHYVVIRGISEDGVIINDPWGKPFINSDGKGEYYTIMIGDNVFLKQKEFDKQYFQDGHFYSCLTIKAKRWNFVSRDPKYDIINKDFLQNCRDADGTCDYETAVRLQSGKRYRASDNLRLRASGSTAGKPIVTIGKGTQVKVLGIGTEQTIDGITSDLVQVKVQAGAKDRDGKPIDAGTVGWCFGGYLGER